MSYDGPVSRYLNRPLSRPLARAAGHTPLTPNLVTSATLLLAVAAAAMVAAGWNIAGGIAIQAVSVADGVDGDLARLKGMTTRFGAVFDAVTDRYADAAIIAGMTIYAARFEDFARPETAGVFALAGALAVSYSRARIEASLGAANDAPLFFGATRDVRSLIAAVGAVTGQCYWTLILLGALSSATVLWRLLYLRAKGIGRRPDP